MTASGGMREATPSRNSRVDWIGTQCTMNAASASALAASVSAVRPAGSSNSVRYLGLWRVVLIASAASSRRHNSTTCIRLTEFK